MSLLTFVHRICPKCCSLNNHVWSFNSSVKHNLTKHTLWYKHTCLVLSKKYIGSNNYYNCSELLKHLQPKHFEVTALVRAFCIQSYELKDLINNPKVKTYIHNLVLEYRESLKNGSSNLSEKLPQFTLTARLLENKANFQDNLKSLEELAGSGRNDSKDDYELAQLVEAERKEYAMKLKEIDIEIIKSLIPKSPLDDCNRVVMEISAGVGGQEAMLFAKDLYTMYCGYIQIKGWTMELVDYDSSDLGGLRHASFLVYGTKAFKYLNTEGGVHRVQRVPTTEKSGRIHTSTVSVAVFPQPEEVDVVLNEKDLKIETKRASGAGGQHVNTTDSAVRIVHIPSGISVECQKDRSQIKNKEFAMRKLRAKLYEIQVNEQLSKINSSRKIQVGTSARSEKIRTYNFNQDRITDHRLSSNAHNLVGFLQGGEPFHKLVEQLLEMQEKQSIDDFIQNINTSL